ncbi:MAG: hypothetical protein MUQ65_05685 [Armatimonadetes bacterium]|nr:hypothetical protein [Armatimonadota bacterium]
MERWFEVDIVNVKKARKLSVIPVIIAALMVIGTLGLSVPLKTSATTDVMLMEIDIGNLESEELAVSMPGWGPIEPETHGGDWGGYGTSGDDTRVIWYAADDDERWAILQLSFVGSARAIEFFSLDGAAGDDGFKVYMLPGGWSVTYGDVVEEVPAEAWIEVYSYDSDTSTNEYWEPHTVDISTALFPGVARGGCGEFAVKFEATGEPWTLFETYGQVAIDYFQVWGNGQELVV